MRLTKLLFGLAIISIFTAATAFIPANSTDGEWFFLEDKKVGFGIDHDVIHFGNWKDDVRQIKLRVTDGPLRMYNMKIHFDNGGEQTVELKNRFNAGMESRVIDLDGGLRHLSKIEFWYETRGFARGKARIAVWGRN